MKTRSSSRPLRQLRNKPTDSPSPQDQRKKPTKSKSNPKKKKEAKVQVGQVPQAQRGEKSRRRHRRRHRVRIDEDMNKIKLIPTKEEDFQQSFQQDLDLYLLPKTCLGHAFVYTQNTGFTVVRRSCRIAQRCMASSSA